MAAEVRFRAPPFLRERDIEDMSEIFMFEDDIRPYYDQYTVEEDSYLRDYLSHYAEKNKGSGARGIDHMALPRKTNVTQTTTRKALGTSANKAKAFWKDASQGYDDKAREDMFMAMKDYSYFTDNVKNTGNPPPGMADPAEAFFRSRNALEEEEYFDTSVPKALMPSIMDSVEFNSLFSMLSILMGSKRKFRDLPKDLTREVGMYGCHQAGISKQEYVNRTGERIGQVIVEYSIDPSYIIKEKEKVERRVEREERRVIRIMAKQDRKDETYLPKSQRASKSILNQNNENGKAKVGNDGGVISDSSDSDSGSDEEADAVKNMITSSRNKYARSGFKTQSEMEKDSHKKDGNGALTLTEQALEDQMNTFATHVRIPMSYSLTDHNIRQFLDIHLRILILLTINPSEEEQYEMKRFLFFISR